MDDVRMTTFRGPGGATLAYRELGEGRPIVLLHGFVSTATVNWVRYGHAAAIAEHGFRVIMPDLRGHGDSDRSHDPRQYPPDILVDDAFALLEHLGLSDYDLGGYSLGAHVTVRMLARGAAPRRALIGAIGLDFVLDPESRVGFFHNMLVNRGTFQRGTAEWQAEAFMHQLGGDPEALLLVLGTHVPTPLAAVRAITSETMVAVGADDERRDAAAELAAAIPGAAFTVIPGNHMSAVMKPDLGRSIAEFVSRVERG